MLSISGRDHVVTRCFTSELGGRIPRGWTVRLLVLADQPGDGHPYWPLYDYFRANYHRSDAWQAMTARALGLFWDYCGARLPQLPPDADSDWRDRELLRGFAAALCNGTVGDLNDPLGLYWVGQPLTLAKRLMYALEKFADWRARETNTPNVLRGSIRVQTIDDIAMSAAMSVKRQSFSLLGYLADQTKSRQPMLIPFPKLGRQDSTGNSGPLAFPPAIVEDVLWNGFRRPDRLMDGWDAFNLPAMMIFLLQAYGGARAHEPFHLWVSDVTQDPEAAGRAAVFLYHPREGLAYFDGPNGRPIRTTRAQKLEQDYRLPPRTQGSGSYRIGWKNSKVESGDHYAMFYWTDPTAAVLFWILYQAYLPRRMAIMNRRRALGYGDHPFLFVSEREARNSPEGSQFIGAPASIESYDRALQRAVEGSGLPYGKAYGTTSHGLRHLYAYTLRKLGTTPKIIQEGLRHRSLTSQERYGLPTPADITASLEQARLEQSEKLPPGIALSRTPDWLAEISPKNLGKN